MARAETVFVQSHPDRVNETIQEYEAFNWRLIGTQQITDENFSQNYSAGTITRKTRTYTKITFSRDIDDMQPRFNELEDQYRSKLHTIELCEKWKRDNEPKFSIKLFIVSIIVAIVGFMNYYIYGMIGILGCAVVICLYIPKNKEYNSRVAKDKEIIAKCQEEAAAIISTARTL